MGRFLSGMATAVVLGLVMWLLEPENRRFGKGDAVVEVPDAVLWRDSLGRHHARVRMLEAERAGLLLDLAYRDSLLRAVRAELERQLERGGSAVVVEAVTRVDTVFVTKAVVDTVPGSPVYEAAFDLGGWVSGSARAGRDSLRLDLLVRNAYTAVVGWERKGLFGKRRPYVEVMNLNPWTETMALRALSVSAPRQGRWWIGPVAGMGLNGRPFVGAGVGYGLWGR